MCVFVLEPELCASHMLDKQALCRLTTASTLQNHIFFLLQRKTCCISFFSKKLTAILFWMLYSKKAQSHCRWLCPICPLSSLWSEKKNPISDYWPTTSLRKKGWFKKVSQKYRQAEEYCYTQPVHIPSINRIMNKPQRSKRSPELRKWGWSISQGHFH